MAWLGTWQNRRKITISNTNVDATLSNFPILLALSASAGTGSADVTDIFTEIGSDANRKKIAVTTSDGTTQCYVEIERWDHANSVAWLWTKIPSISATVVTDFYLYYDSAQADNTTYVGDTTDTPAQSVWDSNFKAVYHMAQDPNGDVANAIKDSTSNANHGTPTGTMITADLIDGKIGKAIDFDGGDDSLNCGSSSSLNISGALTIDAIIKASATQMRCIGSFGGGGIGPFVYQGSTGVTDAAMIGYRGSPEIRTAASVIISSQWQYLTWVYDGNSRALTSSYQIYADGVVKTPLTSSGSIGGTQSLNTIGCDQTQAFFSGDIDEFRISATNRSAAWTKATYYSNWDGIAAFGVAESGFENIEVLISCGVVASDILNLPDEHLAISIISSISVQDLRIMGSEDLEISIGAEISCIDMQDYQDAVLVPLVMDIVGYDRYFASPRQSYTLIGRTREYFIT